MPVSLVIIIMSSRSIISSSFGCKCSFDHSLHFVSIYQSQDSVNLKQQHSKSKETWAPRALMASWRGGVWVGLFSKLFTSKNFQTAVGYSSKRQEEIFTLSRQALWEWKAKRLPVAGSPSLLQRIGNKHRRGSPPLAKPLLCQSTRKAPGADPQRTEITETNRPNS